MSETSKRPRMWVATARGHVFLCIPHRTGDVVGRLTPATARRLSAQIAQAADLAEQKPKRRKARP
jgi:hypothetical protein